MDITHWNHNHMLAYACFCIADADHELDNEEWRSTNAVLFQYIKDKRATENLALEVYDVIAKHSLADKKAFIAENLDKFIHDKEEFLQNIEEVIIADLHVESDEMKMYREIKNALK